MEIRAWDIKYKEMIYIDDLYWFEEEGIHEIENGEAYGHHGIYKVMFCSGLLDQNKNKIWDGDIVIGHQSWVKGDGYLKKRYPKTIDVLCEVVFKRGQFKTVVRKPTKEHKEAFENNNYRSVEYQLDPMWSGGYYQNQETMKFDIPGDDKTCRNIGVVGNIYEDANLLK